MVREFNSVKGLQLVKLPRDMSPQQAIQAWSRDQEVLYAEPNYLVRASATPDDPRFPSLGTCTIRGRPVGSWMSTSMRPRRGS